jgi:hypothetical protein
MNDTLDVTTAHQEDPPAWAEKHFGEVDLGDPRRNRRAVTIATAMATNPDRSIPQMFLNTYYICLVRIEYTKSCCQLIAVQGSISGHGCKYFVIIRAFVSEIGRDY